ncbi:MAG TPA: GNAT family N-acetyltransferase [Bryobacteraceae bacterium]|nr:GNAT family N-acetyltransferase [Bryobacteraceae bacterium]
MPDRPDYLIVEENLRTAMRFFGQAREQGALQEAPGVSLIFSGIDYSVFNSALLSTPVHADVTDLKNRIATAASHFGPRGFRWSFWLCEDMLDRSIRRQARNTFAAGRLWPFTDPPGMLAERLAPVSRPLPDIEYRRVTDAVTRLTFAHITCIGFEIPYMVARQVYELERAWSGDYVGWIGYANGVPVATAATVVAAGAVGVYSVATLPAWRRRGYAEALLRRVLGDIRARTGIERTVLQSSKAGLSLYEKMGYRMVTRFIVYLSEP